ncbi:MAG: four helix bundle protein [Saprospiraceae bacterium]
MKNFKTLRVWEEAMELVKMIYPLVGQLPKSEMLNLKNQIQRSAVSIPSNIAEGCGRESAKELNRFLDIAVGSAFELETQLFVCIKVGYFSEEQLKRELDQVDKVQKMIYRFKQNLK